VLVTEFVKIGQYSVKFMTRLNQVIYFFSMIRSRGS